MSSFEEIIKAKDLQIAELLVEIQTLKTQLHTNVETLDNLEVTIDNADISETISLKDDDVEEDTPPNIMNLLNMFMGGGMQESASANPFAEIMQKMMAPEENGSNPFAEMMQKIMTPDSSQ